MVASYPADLPPPLKQGFQHARGDGRYQAREDAGPPTTRGRFSSVADTSTYSLTLDRSQLAVFDRFYNEDTKQGKLPFLLPDPTTDGWPLLTDDGQPILTEDDEPILLSETWLVMFGKGLPRRSQPVGLLFRLDFDLVILPP